MKVEVKNLSLTYKDFDALKNLSFTLEDGKTYGLLGRNGAGKTSLLSLIASFREPTEGKILIDGEEPFENAKIMQQVSFIYEKNYKEETGTVKEMLQIAEYYRPNYDKEYAAYLIDRFNLPLKKPVYKLSKGMQSAMNVTIGLASRTPVTIFDEAYLGMDAPTRDIFYKEILADQEKFPRVIILSTHLVSEMDYLFDEVLILKNGELIVHEEYEDLISKGASITGEATIVDEFTQGMKILNEQRLGNTKSVMVYEKLPEDRRNEAQRLGLDVGPISLQDLFIHLTGEVQ
jgi:ABC-2 type transport system ATP-binding protein